MYKGKAEIIYNSLETADVYRLIVKINSKVNVKPGQFTMLDTGTSEGMILKRPISIHSFSEDKITFLYAIKGKGTKALSNFKVNDTIDVLLPLGNGFPEVKSGQKVVLIGGGLGIFPLYSVFNSPSDAVFFSYLGFRDKDCVMLESDFSKHSKSLKLSTDDGSCGVCDLITNVLKNDLENIRPDMIFACGPTPMFKALKAIVGNIPTYVSLEQRMACGFGACLVCTCQTKDGNKRTCKEGPIFEINEVVL